MSSSVFDTVLLLTIGASLGAIAMYYFLKDKISEIKSASLSRRVALLEQVSQHIGKVSHVFSRYISLASEIGPSSERMSVKQERELEELSTQLVTIYEEAAIAESKLLLLGEQKLEKALKLYTAKMAKFHRQIYPGRYRSAEEASKLRTEVNEMKQQFYNILSDRYDNSAS